MDDIIGNFETGKDADSIVIAKASTEFMQLRLQQRKDSTELLFVVAMLGDDSSIKQTCSGGALLHDRERARLD